MWQEQQPQRQSDETWWCSRRQRWYLGADREKNGVVLWEKQVVY